MAGFLQGLLSGLVGGAAEHISSERERTRAEEDRILEQRRGALDYLLKGVQEGTVNPTYFAQIWQDLESLNKPGASRKRKGGKEGFMGATELPVSSLLESVASGRVPFMDQGAPAPSGRPAPPGPAAPGQNVGMPAPPSAENPQGLIPPPQLPGTARMTTTAGDLAADVQQHGPQGLFFSPTELATRKAASQRTELSGLHSTLVDLLGPDTGNLAFAAKLGYNQPITPRAFADYVDSATGARGRGGFNPLTRQFEFINGAVLPDGRLLPPGTPITAPQQLYAPTTVTSDEGVVRGVDRTTGREMFRTGTGIGRRSATQTPVALEGGDVGSFDRTSGTVRDTGAKGRPITEPTVIDTDAADAQKQMEIINKMAGDDLASIADPNKYKDEIAQRIYHRSWEDVLRAAGRAARRPAGTSIPKPPAPAPTTSPFKIISVTPIKQ